MTFATIRLQAGCASPHGSEGSFQVSQGSACQCTTLPLSMRLCTQQYARLACKRLTLFLLNPTYLAYCALLDRLHLPVSAAPACLSLLQVRTVSIAVMLHAKVLYIMRGVSHCSRAIVRRTAACACNVFLLCCQGNLFSTISAHHEDLGDLNGWCMSCFRPEVRGTASVFYPAECHHSSRKWSVSRQVLVQKLAYPIVAFQALHEKDGMNS